MKKNNNSVLIVAEISANHGQNFNRAVAMIKRAKECGVDAVKFQTYTPDTITIDCNKKYFMIKHPKWGGQTLYQLYKKAYTPWSWFKKLKKTADDLGIVFFSTAFDKTSVDFLEELDVSIHKIASFELIDLPLIEYVAKTKKPLIISTGMSILSEIRQAVNIAKKAGVKEITLLKCVSDYPAKAYDMNLKTIPHMKKMFNCPVGISDHSLGIGVSIAAATLGANLIEKHFTLSRKLETPDSFFSIEPEELKFLVENVKFVEKALGKVYYGLTESEKKNRIFRRSLFAIKDIKKGELLNESNVRSIRPAYGLQPKFFKKIMGKITKVNIPKGEPLKLNFIK